MVLQAVTRLANKAEDPFADAGNEVDGVTACYGVISRLRCNDMG